MHCCWCYLLQHRWLFTLPNHIFGIVYRIAFEYWVMCPAVRKFLHLCKPFHSFKVELFLRFRSFVNSLFWWSRKHTSYFWFDFLLVPFGSWFFPRISVPWYQPIFVEHRITCAEQYAFRITSKTTDSGYCRKSTSPLIGHGVVSVLVGQWNSGSQAEMADPVISSKLWYFLASAVWFMDGGPVSSCWQVQVFYV